MLLKQTLTAAMAGLGLLLITQAAAGSPETLAFGKTANPNSTFTLLVRGHGHGGHGGHMGHGGRGFSRGFRGPHFSRGRHFGHRRFFFRRHHRRFLFRGYYGGC